MRSCGTCRLYAAHAPRLVVMPSTENSTRFVGFHVPEDQALLAAIGEVALRHGT